jgi:putative transcriptional regulator
VRKKIEKAVIKSLRQAAAIREGTARPAKAYTVFQVRRLSAAPAPSFTADRIVALRMLMECSQSAFANLLNVSAPTVRAWEQNQRRPRGAAARLLQVLAANPEVLREVVTPRRVSAVRKRAVGALGSSQRATQWLESPNPALSGARPGDIAAASAEGVQIVLAILERIEHGIGF